MSRYVWNEAQRKMVPVAEPIAKEPVEKRERSTSEYSRPELVAACREKGISAKGNMNRGLLLRLLNGLTGRAVSDGGADK